MSKVTREEVKKLAELTKVSFQEHELDGIIQQLNDVLDYAQRVVQIAQEQVDIPSCKNINCNRADIIKPTDVAPILAQAPQQEDNYFVVPKFLDN
ncbi:MAG TPA: Asp-tRNA(Asn)/Glu-tRNA(Gln) amidotransferase subunit GatC [Candidatus Saccharimonadales bacterium]|nr:Asp-tRNA(Asn)/Glu-tRNA(Gln) amidotransferase subunit GatC [Candidatus Saccharimonadales bacterium]